MNEEELWEIEEQRRSYHADEFPWPYVDRLTVALRECQKERERQLRTISIAIRECDEENERLRGAAEAYQAFVHEVSEHDGDDEWACEYDPCRALRRNVDPQEKKGVPHDHPEYVEGCFRCDLSAQENP